MVRFLAGHTLLSLIFALATAAPVPAQPTKLTPELLGGKWDYLWGPHECGWILFGDDGCYLAQHCTDGPYYVGEWSVTGTTITLLEGEGRARYEFAMSMARWPTLEGKSNGTCRVRLRRFPKE